MSAFKAFEKNGWEAKAKRYDTTWGQVTCQAAAPLLNRVGPLKGKKLLDCGAGPGHLCHLANNQGAIVTGGDYSAEMVSIAKGNYPSIPFQIEDAEQLSFEDNTFDIVIMSFLLLHVSDQRKVLLEAQRVLKPGGKLAFTIWSPPTESPCYTLLYRAIDAYADTSVIPPSKDDAFLFSDPDYSHDFLLTHGFKDITIENINTYWNIQSPDDFFYAVQAGIRIRAYA